MALAPFQIGSWAVATTEALWVEVECVEVREKM